MSVRAIEWARAQRTGSLTTKAVLAYLAERANDDGECWPSVDLIADEMEAGRRTVIRAIGTLAKGGWLTVARTGKSNVYRLPLGARAAPVDDSEVPERHLRCAAAAPEKCQSGTSEVPERHPNLKEPSKNRQRTGEGARKRAPPATRLPADWMPSVQELQFARNEGLSDEQINRAVDRFTDHYRGTGRRAADWAAFWRNWVRQDSESAGTGTGRALQPHRGRSGASGGNQGGRKTQGDTKRSMARGLALAVDKQQV